MNKMQILRYINGILIEKDQKSIARLKEFLQFQKALKDRFKSCRPMLFLDGTFLKGQYKGILLAAIAKDGNNGLFSVVIGVVDLETIDNWV
ncbi:hypothetical protein LguiB_001041 [Lonicera macranthoides]